MSLRRSQGLKAGKGAAACVCSGVGPAQLSLRTGHCSKGLLPPPRRWRMVDGGPRLGCLDPDKTELKTPHNQIYDLV